MWKGSIVALVTPMLDDGRVDIPTLLALVQWHLQAGTHGVVVAGSTGEGITLSEQERGEILSVVRHAVGGKIPVIAGTGTACTQQTIAYTQAAAAQGADACLVVTPYYNRPTQEGLYQHYAAIAAAVDIPLILYNVPGRTACDLRPETIARLSHIPQIIGIKEATGDVARVATLRKLCRPDFLLWSGDDSSFVDFMQAGGDGVISVCANVAPEAMVAVTEAALVGDWALARACNAPLEPLHAQLVIEPNPIPVKWALGQLGRLPTDHLRLPLTRLSVARHLGVQQALDGAKQCDM